MKILKLSLVGISLLLLNLGCGRGDAGPPGPPGPIGLTGASGRIVTTINCAGTISGLTGFAGTALNGLHLEYDVAVTSSGDVFATANVIDSLKQTSGTSLFAAGQNGAADAVVVVTADYDGGANGGYFDISVNRQTLITSVVYRDSSLGSESPVNISFTASSCTSYNW